ncbi:hypothetical protein ACQ4LE_009949, partial [Meloidogyne hapla]
MMERINHDVINIEDVSEVQDVHGVDDGGHGLKPESNQNFRTNISCDDNKNLVNNSTEQLIKSSNDQLTTSKEPLNKENNKIYASCQLILLLLSYLKKSINKTKLFWIVAIYTLVGANLFMWLEIPYDLEIREEARDYHLMARDSLLFKVHQIHQTREILEKNQQWKQAIIEFEQAIDCGLPQIETQWTFWMSILYCATIYTTVGYGNIACITISGRIVTIIYAICGIPMMIVVLDQLGTFLLKLMKQINNFIDDLIFFLGVKFNFIHLNNQESFLRYIFICKILSNLKLISNTITLTISEQSLKNNNSSSSISSSSSVSSATLSLKGKLNIYQGKQSLNYAVSKGSLLNNLEPYQIETIIDPRCNLITKKLLSSKTTNKANTETLNKTNNKTQIKLKLNEAKELFLKSSSIAAVQSNNLKNDSIDIEKQNNLNNSKETILEEEEEQSIKSPPQSSSGKSTIKHNPPLFIALIVTTGWIFLAAAIFCLWEEWSYFTSIYFFFISMSTIGFGDITPQHPQYMIMSFFVVIVGLSLVSVCINVVQEKVAQLYMEILNKMLQQYMKACASGDVEALKGAMAGFNSRCKYIMPFISKNQGIRLMSQFKEEARAMGVDLPEIMTELNEETGKPTFCKIFDEKCDERVNQFLEKANHQSKIKKNIHTQTKQLPLQKTHKFFISRAEEMSEKEENDQDKEVETQTETLLNKTLFNNFGIQCSPLMQDNETQYKLPNEILNKLFIDCCTNTFTIPLRNQGIQPEVSCIMRILDDDGSSDEIFNYPIEESAEFSSSGLSALNQNYLSGSSRDDELNERKLSISSKRSQQMKRMEEIEVEDYNNLERKGKSLPKVTIHMASTGRGTTIDNEDDEGDTNLI